MANHYQNPVFWFNPAKWSLKNQIRFMEANVIINSIAPIWLLHFLDCSKSSRDYRKRIWDAKQVALERETVKYYRKEKTK